MGLKSIGERMSWISDEFQKDKDGFFRVSFFGSSLSHLVFYSALICIRRYRVPSSEQNLSNSGGCGRRGLSGEILIRSEIATDS